MIHYSHDFLLVPPTWILYTLDLATHDNDLACWDELTTTIGRAKMLRYARRCDVAIERPSHAVDQLRSLLGAPRSWRA